MIVWLIWILRVCILAWLIDCLFVLSLLDQKHQTVFKLQNKDNCDQTQHQNQLMIQQHSLPFRENLAILVLMVKSIPYDILPMKMASNPKVCQQAHWSFHFFNNDLNCFLICSFLLYKHQKVRICLLLQLYKVCIWSSSHFIQ